MEARVGRLSASLAFDRSGQTRTEWVRGPLGNELVEGHRYWESVTREVLALNPTTARPRMFDPLVDGVVVVGRFQLMPDMYR